jgi:hypothetical protein
MTLAVPNFWIADDTGARDLLEKVADRWVPGKSLLYRRE